MSKGTEKVLRRMIQPNADLRCTALEVLQDPYWDASLPASAHKRPASSGTADKSKSHNGIPPLSSCRGSRAQQREREQTKRKCDDKENSPMTVPNPKKSPARQRITSGTDGSSLRFLLIVNVNDLLFSSQLNEEAAQRQFTPPHPIASTREYVCTQAEVPKGPG
jgi:hypothetical protein